MLFRYESANLALAYLNHEQDLSRHVKQLFCGGKKFGVSNNFNTTLPDFGLQIVIKRQLFGKITTFNTSLPDFGFQTD